MNRRDRNYKRNIDNRSYVSFRDPSTSMISAKRKSYHIKSNKEESVRDENDCGSSIRRKTSSTYLRIPLTLKRKKSLNELYNKKSKVSARTIQIPNNILKPSNKQIDPCKAGDKPIHACAHSGADDMDIDENQGCYNHYKDCSKVISQKVNSSGALYHNNNVEICDDMTGCIEMTSKRSLVQFYPSSIKASKELNKSTGFMATSYANRNSKTDADMEDDTDEAKLSKFKENCKNQLSVSFGMKTEDFKTLDIPEEVSEYADQVVEHMQNVEDLHLPTYGYMKNQPDINEKMRAILIDWLIEVHFKFKLLPETLFITVNLIDRFLELCEMKRQRLQLLGVTAMWIACKYEEIYAPEIKDFVYITDNAYQQKDILELEYDLLKTLEFNVTTSSSYRFLQRYAKLLGVNDRTFKLAWYLIELPLIEYKMLKYKPSLIS